MRGSGLVANVAVYGAGSSGVGRVHSKAAGMMRELCPYAPVGEGAGSPIKQRGAMQGQPQGVAEETRDRAPGWRHRDIGRPHCGEALPRFPLDDEGGVYDF